MNGSHLFGQRRAAKLSDEDVRAIRRLAATMDGTDYSKAPVVRRKLQLMRVATSTIWDVIRRASFASIT